MNVTKCCLGADSCGSKELLGCEQMNPIAATRTDKLAMWSFYRITLPSSLVCDPHILKFFVTVSTYESSNKKTSVDDHTGIVSGLSVLIDRK